MSDDHHQAEPVHPFTQATGYAGRFGLNNYVLSWMAMAVKFNRLAAQARQEGDDGMADIWRFNAENARSAYRRRNKRHNKPELSDGAKSKEVPNA